jgi:hypothetical protein
MRRASISAAVVCLAISAVVAFIGLGTKHPAGLFPKAYAQNGCSVETLNASYGFAGDGFSTSGPVPANISAFTPVATIGVDTFDGAGHLSGSITVSFGGLIVSSPLSGTYTVNADCTGSATVTETNSGFVIHLIFVIVDHGMQLRNLDTDTGSVSFATAVRQ